MFVFKNIRFFDVDACCACMPIGAPCVYNAQGQQRRRWIPCDWSDRQLGATAQVLGTEPTSSARAAITLNC